VAVLERWPTINPSSRAFAAMARDNEDVISGAPVQLRDGYITRRN
jgi:hypothetical protein